MTVNLATVGYAVDTRGLKAGTQALDGFEKANLEAAKGVKAVEKASSTSGAAVAQATGRVRDARGRFIGLGGAAQEAAKGIEHTGRAANRASRPLMDYGAQLSRVTALFGGLVAAFGAVSLFESANEYTRLTNALRVMGLSASEAEVKLGELADVARDTRGNLSGTVQLYQRVSMAARDLGASSEDAMKFTRAVNLAMAQTGQGGAAAEGAMTQLAQALGGTNIQAEEFNSLIDGAYPLVLAAARGIDAAGGSVGRLRQLIKDGEVTSRDFFNAIIGQTDVLEAALAGTALTVGQAWGVFRDTLTMSVGELDKTLGVTNGVASALMFMSTALASATSFLSENAGIMERFTSYAAAAAVVLAGPYVAGLVAARVATFTFAGALGVLRTALIRIGIGAVIVLVGELIHQFLRVVESTGGIGKAFVWLGELASAVWHGIVETAKAVPDGLNGIWQLVVAGFNNMMATLAHNWSAFIGNLALAAESAGLSELGVKLRAAAFDAGSGIVDSLNAASAASAKAEGHFASASERIAAGWGAVKDKLAELTPITEEIAGANDAAAAAATNAGNAAETAGDKADKAGGKGKKAAEEAEKAAKEWADALQNEVIRAIEGVSDAFGQWVSRGFRDFKSFANSILDTFQSMLANMVSMAMKNRIMLSMGIDPMSGALSRAGVPGVGGGGILGTALGTWGGAGGILGGLSGVTSGISAGWASGGILGALGGGVSSSIAGISGGLAAGGLAGITSAIGAAIPIIGAVAAVVSIGKKLFGRKLKDTGIEATFDMAEGIAAHTYKFYKGGWFRSDKTKRSDLDEETETSLGNSFRAMGESVKTFASELGLQAKKVDGVVAHLKFSTKGMSEEDIRSRLQESVKTYGEEAAAAVGGAMLEALTREGETAVDALARLATGLSAFNNNMKLLGLNVQRVGMAGAAAASKFIDLFGGLDQFNQAAAFYYDNFYTLAEKQRNAQRSLSATMGELGVKTIPQTTAQFRKLVERMDEAGRTKAVATMMQIAPQFVEFLKLTEELGKNVDEVDPSILRESIDLERRLAQAQGNTSKLRRMELDALHPTNRALMRQVWAAERAAEVAEERSDLERELLQVQGKTSQLRRMELAGLDKSNRALQQQIWAAEAAARVSDERKDLERELLEVQGKTSALRQLELAALAPANRALQRKIWAEERAAAVQEERRSLEEQLLQAQGNTVELRRRELAQLDPTNRALQKQIWAAEKAAQVADERTDLERALLEAQGNTVALRRLELAALDPTNRALQQRIWAEEKARDIAEERADLEERLAEATGNTAWLRAKELAGLDASNRALQRMVWAIEDAKEAVSTAEEAVRRSAEAERQRISDLRATADELRGLSQQAMSAFVESTEVQRQSAEAQLRLAMSTGKAWDASMTDLARTTANISSSEFGSYVEFLAASARAAALLDSAARDQERQAITAEEKLEAALKKYGLQDETVASLDQSLRDLEEAIRQLAQAQNGPSGVQPQFAQLGGYAGLGPAVIADQFEGPIAPQARLTQELRDEVRRLREENNLGHAQVAKNTRMTADIQRGWQIDGMPPVREDS